MGAGIRRGKKFASERLTLSRTDNFTDKFAMNTFNFHITASIQISHMFSLENLSKIQIEKCKQT